MNYIICILIYFLQPINSNCSNQPGNIACGKTAVQSSDYGYLFAARSVDGDFKTNFESCTHTDSYFPQWLKINLLNQYYINKVIILGRNESVFRLDYFIVGLSNYKDAPERGKYDLCGQYSSNAISGAIIGGNMTVYCSYQQRPRQYIIVQQPIWFTEYIFRYISVCELQAFGVKANNSNDCPIGLYSKPLCDKVCHCENGLPCDQPSGKCDNGCLTDWKGETCDQYIHNFSKEANYSCNKVNSTIIIQIWDINNSTTSNCIAYCFLNGYIYAGINYAKCLCGSETLNISMNVEPGVCNSQCFNDLACKNFTKYYSVCPPNYFGYKCRFKCWCHSGTCRTDGTCIENNGRCKDDMWIPPTCHLRDCTINKTCETHGTCKSTLVNGETFWFCQCKTGFQFINDTCADVNECEDVKLNTCNSSVQTCDNTIGSYSCNCKTGYSYDFNNKCKDIDECINESQCNTSIEYCLNNHGSYACIKNETHPRNYAAINNQTLVWPIIVGSVLAGILIIVLIIILIRKLILNRELSDKPNISVSKNITPEPKEIDMQQNYESLNKYENDKQTYSELILKHDDKKHVVYQNID